MCSSARTRRRSPCWLPCTVASRQPACCSACRSRFVRLATSAGSCFALTAWNAPAPLHLAGGVLSARGLTWARASRPDRRVSASATRKHFATHRRIGRARVSPRRRRAPSPKFGSRCASRRSTRRRSAPPPGRSRTCCARRSAARRATSDLLIPAVDLSALFPDAAARFVAARGRRRALWGRRARARGGGRRSRAHARRRARDLCRRGRRRRSAPAGGARSETTPDAAWSDPLAQVAAFRVRIHHDDLPGIRRARSFAAPMLRLDDAPGQWAFDRRSALRRDAPPGTRALIAVVISASGPHDALDQSTLASERRIAIAAACPRPAAAHLHSRDRRAPRDVCLHADARASQGAASCARDLSRRRLHRSGISGDARSRHSQRRRGRRGAYRRLRSSRCCSRFHSRSLIVARLSYCFLPLASPRSSLMRPLL